MIDTLSASFLKTKVLRISLYVCCFGLIMVVALLNPQDFLLVLEVFTSLSLNVEGGTLNVDVMDRWWTHFTPGCSSTYVYNRGVCSHTTPFHPAGTGYFIGYMFYIARKTNALQPIPLQLGSTMSYGWVFSCTFFLAAGTCGSVPQVGLASVSCTAPHSSSPPAVIYDIITASITFFGPRNGAILLIVVAVLVVLVRCCQLAQLLIVPQASFSFFF